VVLLQVCVFGSLLSWFTLVVCADMLNSIILSFSGLTTPLDVIKTRLMLGTDRHGVK
jgi:hypothetical protein